MFDLICSSLHSFLFPFPIKVVAAETLIIAILAITATIVNINGLLTALAVVGIANAPLSGTRLSLFTKHLISILPNFFS